MATMQPGSITNLSLLNPVCVSPCEILLWYQCANSCWEACSQHNVADGVSGWSASRLHVFASEAHFYVIIETTKREHRHWDWLHLRHIKIWCLQAESYQPVESESVQSHKKSNNLYSIYCMHQGLVSLLAESYQLGSRIRINSVGKKIKSPSAVIPNKGYMCH